MIKIALLILLASFSYGSAFAETVPNSNPAPLAQPRTNSGDATPKENTSERGAPPSVGRSSRVGWLSSFEFGMSLSVLCFGLLVFTIEIITIKLGNFGPEQTIKLLAVTLIVISTLFIITAGFDSEQIAPAMGLFGTIAGYMLGRAGGRPSEEARE